MMKLHLREFDETLTLHLSRLYETWTEDIVPHAWMTQARAAQEEMLRARMDAHDGIFHHLRFLVKLFWGLNSTPSKKG